MTNILSVENNSTLNNVGRNETLWQWMNSPFIKVERKKCPYDVNRELNTFNCIYCHDES